MNADIIRKYTIPADDGQLRVQVVELGETSSTNDFLHASPMPPCADMLVATALHQTAGRGQGTNRWESEAGKNLLFSALVEPRTVPVAQQFMLSMAGALALKDALDAYAQGFSLKWPNDIYWHDSKISGTLIETSVSGRTLSRCIFGTGVNVNQRRFVSGAPNPVSLCSIIGREVPVHEVLGKVLAAFARYFRMVGEGAYAELERLYHAALYRRHGLHKYRDSVGEFLASVHHVAPDGRLFLALQSGEVRSYAFKEVAFVLPVKTEQT